MTPSKMLPVEAADRLAPVAHAAGAYRGPVRVVERGRNASGWRYIFYTHPEPSRGPWRCVGWRAFDAPRGETIGGAVCWEESRFGGPDAIDGSCLPRESTTLYGSEPAGVARVRYRLGGGRSVNVRTYRSRRQVFPTTTYHNEFNRFVEGPRTTVRFAGTPAIHFVSIPGRPRILGKVTYDARGRVFQRINYDRPSRARSCEGRVPEQPPPPPPPSEGYPEPPQPTPGCNGTVTVTPIEALSECFQGSEDRPGVFSAEGRVRINGIDITPIDSGSRIEIDTNSVRVSSTGRVQVQIGGVELARLDRIDWNLRGVTGIEVTSAERDPTSDDFTFTGLTLKGSAELVFEPGRTAITVGIDLPDFLAPPGLDGISGEVSMIASNSAGLQFAGEISADSVMLGPVEVRDVRLSARPSDTGAFRFEGEGTIYIAPSSPFAIQAGLGFGTDGFFRVAGGFDGLNRPIGQSGFFFQRISFEVSVNPFSLGGGAGVSFGPQIRLRGEDPFEVASLDGSFLYEAGPPWSITLSGEVRVVEAKLLSAGVTVKPGEISARGQVDFTKFGYGLRGQIEGWATREAFNVSGSVTASLPGPDLSGHGVLSSVGVAACRRGIGPDFGFGYRWGENVEFMSGVCGIGPWEARRAIARAAQAGQGFRLPRSLRVATFSAVGALAAPKVTLTGPRGVRVVTPPGPTEWIDERRVFLLQDQGQRTTYIAVANPPRGRWTLTLQPGSSPVTEYRSAQSLPPVRVRARVRGRGSRRRLTWAARNLGGQRITFVEAGRGVRRVIIRTGRSRGSARFRPGPGGRGRRRIVAIVTQAGLPRSERTIARFRAPAVARARRPGRIRIGRARRLSRTIAWGGSSRVGYRVLVRLSDGRRLMFLPGRARRVTISPVLPRTRLRVRVQAYDRLGRLGPARAGRGGGR